MARKKYIPQGQLNKNQIVFKRLNNLMKDLGQKYSIRVGIIGDKAYEQHPHADLTMAQLGAIHEFGATINVTDKMRTWLHHNDIHLRRETNTVVIPTRSFLRMPLLSGEGKKELRKVVNDNPSADRELNAIEATKNGKILELIAELVAVKALQRVQEAFQTSGFGAWAPITEFTKNCRIGDSSNKPLNDTGDLMNSITYKVTKVK